MFEKEDMSDMFRRAAFEKMNLFGKFQNKEGVKSDKNGNAILYKK